MCKTEIQQETHSLIVRLQNKIAEFKQVKADFTKEVAEIKKEIIHNIDFMGEREEKDVRVIFLELPGDLKIQKVRPTLNFEDDYIELLSKSDGISKDSHYIYRILTI